ncbi:Methyltransferase domain-containing protein [Oribacterium sp. KHPX15]|uniref:class I SAM-dependent methyltransferase n=1 Tax=Oribacterium sp. KHPX15 TaxID=1855342 RepID=UPI0008964923|nr:methyltransferase domain-containing protein [Oribacterium sp. KHPX15]SEA83391.1 Methyltransferase domain-containing protein [Oribacterium sp. KHPX15]
MIKYGKSYTSVSNLKSDFVHNNKSHLEENERIARIYSQQPKRKACKICGFLLDRNSMFHSHGLNYYHCVKCGHINGEYVETNEFTSRIYEQSDYGKAYRMGSKDEFLTRLENIYLPKAEFLRDALKAKSVNPNNIKVLDVGAGSGFFVGALDKLGFSAKGVEVSKAQVEYANEMLGMKLLEHVPQADVVDKICESDAEVISFIGVLEHIVNLNQVLNVVKENQKISYIYFSVPMFSYSVFWEAISNDVFNRLLGGSHTHIFTNSSLEYLYRQNGWKKIAEWRFGTDIPDLQRIIQVKMMENGNEYLANLFYEKLSDVIDKIQLIFDQQEFSSETHVLVEKI